MMDQTIHGSTSTDSIRKVVRVQASAAVAWRVFTEQLATWWPLATHKIGTANAVDAVIEPRVGGRWYERVTTEARVTGAACYRGNLIRASYSPGRSAPTGTTIRP